MSKINSIIASFGGQQYRVCYLCAHQVSIPSFCEAFIDGSLLEMI